MFNREGDCVACLLVAPVILSVQLQSTIVMDKCDETANWIEEADST